MKMALRLAVVLAAAGAIAWGTGAIYYSSPFGEGTRELLAGLWAAASVCAFLPLRNRRLPLLGFGIAFAALLAWWLSISPSNQREWQPDMAVTPWATIEGEQVKYHRQSRWLEIVGASKAPMKP